MATKAQIKLELEAMAMRVHKGNPLSARERRRFRKLACRVGLKSDYRLMAPQHRPLLKNLWRYDQVDPALRERSRALSKRGSGRSARI